jgi:hypothetical protein
VQSLALDSASLPMPIRSALPDFAAGAASPSLTCARVFRLSPAANWRRMNTQTHRAEAGGGARKCDSRKVPAACALRAVSGCLFFMLPSYAYEPVLDTELLLQPSTTRPIRAQ